MTEKILIFAPYEEMVLLSLFTNLRLGNHL